MIDEIKKAYDVFINSLYKDDLKDTGIFGKNSSYKKPYDKVIDIIGSVQAMIRAGLMSYAKEYATLGKECLILGEKKNHKKKSIRWKIKEDEFPLQELIARQLFECALNEDYQGEYLPEIYEETKRLHDYFVNKRSYQNAAIYKKQLAQLAMRFGDLEYALSILKQYNKKLKIVNRKEPIEVVQNNSVFDEITIQAVLDGEVESLESHFDLFYENLFNQSNAGKGMIRHPETLFGTSFLYYRYIKGIQEPNEYAVWQSTLWGYLEKPLTEEEIRNRLNLSS